MQEIEERFGSNRYGNDEHVDVVASVQRLKCSLVANKGNHQFLSNKALYIERLGLNRSCTFRYAFQMLIWPLRENFPFSFSLRNDSTSLDIPTFEKAESTASSTEYRKSTAASGLSSHSSRKI